VTEADSAASLEAFATRLNSRRLVLVTVVAIAFVFVVGSSVRLDGQGLHGDELHQATAAFAFGANQPEIVEGLSIGGIPVLNMPYSGAIKSALFAAYLELPGATFGVLSWRMFGILLTAAGLVGFGLIAGRWVPMTTLLLFLLLVISDAMVMLGSRHDWGPIALALLMRLLLLAIWIRGERQVAPSLVSSFVVGLIAGFAVFEKLSNVAIVAALPVLFGLSRRRRTFRHAGALMGGLAVGSLPLAAANVYTYIRDGSLISLAPKMVRSYSTHRELADYLEHYIGLGAGSEARRFILGSPATTEQPSAEFLIVLALLLMTAASAFIWGRRNDLLRCAAVLLTCYVGIAFVIYAFPRVTWVHHWVIGTPFQYLSFALATAGLMQISREDPTTYRRIWLGFYGVLLTVFILVRCVSVASLERSLLAGEASQHWPPSTTRFGELMSQHVDGGLLITAGWGLAPQAYCLSGGPANFVHDLYWTYQQTSNITNRLEAMGSRVLLAAKPEWWSIVDHSRGRKMWRDLDTIEAWAPDWREVPVDGELGQLQWISVRKFVRVD